MSYTQCPECLTLFRVDGRHLRQAGGVVRCGLCGESFNALASLCDELPEDLPRAPAPEGGSPWAGAPPPPAPERTAPAARRGGPPTPPAPERPESPPPGPGEPPGAGNPPDPGDSPEPGAPPGPDWERATRLEVEAEGDTPSAGRGRALRWISLAVLVAVAVAAQALWQQREALAQDPRWRPWLAEGCELVGCRLPLLERPGAVEVVERRLAADPERADRLRFTATVVNRAAEPLAWPELGLRLLDDTGRTVAEHWFEADAYRAQATGGRGMPAGRPVALVLTVDDPGPGAASFEISFR